MPKHLQMVSKWSSGDPKRSEKVNNPAYNKQISISHFYQLISILETIFSVPANPFSLQVSSQLVSRGAGGRGKALRYIYVYKGASQCILARR